MKKLFISDYSYEKVFLELSDYFKVPLTKVCDEESLSFDNNLGEGIIKGINLDFGIGVFSVNAVFKENFEIKFLLGRRHPILFLNNFKENIEICGDEGEASFKLNSNEALIYGPKGDVDYAIRIVKDKPTQFIFVSVIRYLFLRKVECDLFTLPSSLEQLFMDTTGKKSFIFGAPIAPSSRTLLKLFENKDYGLERKLEIEASSLKTITDLTKMFSTNKDSSFGNYRYRVEDIKQLNKAKDYIIDNLQDNPTVKDIAAIIGMNPNKLQKGFHLLFGKSVRQFTISSKMHMAAEMLKSQEYSITEIAHQLGYTNKGHFSSIFQREFGLLPSTYLDRKSYSNQK